MSRCSPSNCSELTVGKLRDWLNDLRSQNWRDKDYSAAIVRDQDALARIMDHYDFCQRIEKITQNAEHMDPPTQDSAPTEKP